MLDFFLLCILFSIVVFVFVALLFVFLIFGNLSKNISEKMEIAKTENMKNAKKKKNGHFDKNSWHSCVHK